MSEAPLARRVLPLACVALGSMIFSLPLFLSSALPYGSDLGFASHSAHGFIASLDEGNLYPRWVDNSNRGFGGATFIYYSPLAYFLAGAASVFTSDLLDTFRLALAAASLLAALSFYAAARSFTSRGGAALGAILYVLLPYHTLDLYDRFAYAEFVAFIWFPPLFLHARRLLLRFSGGAVAGFAAAYAGLVLTHLVTAYMVVLMLVPYGLLVAWSRRRWRALAAPALAAALTLVACGAFLLPMLSQRDAVNLQWVVEAPYGNWRRNFIYRDEVAHGFSQAPIKPLVNGVATTQGVLALAAGVLILRRRIAARRAVTTPGQNDPAAEEGLAHLALAGWSFFLQIPISAPLWLLVPELGTVQFPWRFGLFQCLSAALLAAAAVAPWPGAPVVPARPAPDALDRGVGWRWGIVILAAAPALACSAWIVAQTPFEFRLEDARHSRIFHRVMDEYLPREFAGWRDFKSAPFALETPPFHAKGVRVEEITSGPSTREIRIESPFPHLLRFPTLLWPGWTAEMDGAPVPLTFDSGGEGFEVMMPAGSHRLRLEHAAVTLDRDGELTIEVWESDRRRIRVRTPGGARLRLRTFAHPGWRARLDGQDTILRHDNPFHAVEIDLPPGAHTVDVSFEPTAERRFGALLSAAGIAALGGLALWTRRRRPAGA